MKKNKNKLVRFFKLIYIKLFRIHDTPQKIALGCGLGVFTGIIPGMGPLAALVLALVFRANRASALFSSVLSNTWTSFLIFLLSIKVGSVIMGLDWHRIQGEWELLLAHFRIADLFKISALEIILPVVVGYAVTALCVALLTYLIALIFVTMIQKRRRLLLKTRG